MGLPPAGCLFERLLFRSRKAVSSAPVAHRPTRASRDQLSSRSKLTRANTRSRTAGRPAPYARELRYSAPDYVRPGRARHPEHAQRDQRELGHEFRDVVRLPEIRGDWALSNEVSNVPLSCRITPPFDIVKFCSVTSVGKLPTCRQNVGFDLRSALRASRWEIFAGAVSE